MIKPNQLESMQVYPDRGLIPNDRFEPEEEETMLCARCLEHTDWRMSGICIDCEIAEEKENEDD